jgi:hypothetical protein
LGTLTKKMRKIAKLPLAAHCVALARGLSAAGDAVDLGRRQAQTLKGPVINQTNQTRLSDDDFKIWIGLHFLVFLGHLATWLEWIGWTSISSTWWMDAVLWTPKLLLLTIVLHYICYLYSCYI